MGLPQDFRPKQTPHGTTPGLIGIWQSHGVFGIFSHHQIYPDACKRSMVSRHVRVTVTFIAWEHQKLAEKGQSYAVTSQECWENQLKEWNRHQSIEFY